MSQITQLGSGTIWICKNCNIWWGSQVGKSPTTNFLNKLHDAGLLPPWDAYRGWRSVLEKEAICQECGTAITMPALQSN